MNPLSTQEKYEYFLNTLSLCGLFLLDCPDNEIEYKIFEEFDSDIRAFLCDENLCVLLNAGLTNRKVFDESQKLRNLLLNLETTGLWNSNSVKTSPEWREIMLLCDSIRNEVKKHDPHDQI